MTVPTTIVVKPGTCFTARLPAPTRPVGGFSLMEVMLVMVLAAMLFAAVGVSVSRSVSGAEIRNAAREVVAGLRQTRTLAIVHRSEQVFHVDARNRVWTVPGRDSVTLPDGLEITLDTARSELTGEEAGGIRFYPDGASTGGTVTLHIDGRAWEITVAWLTGEISINRD